MLLYYFTTLRFWVARLVSGCSPQSGAAAHLAFARQGHPAPPHVILGQCPLSMFTLLSLCAPRPAVLAAGAARHGARDLQYAVVRVHAQSPVVAPATGRVRFCCRHDVAICKPICAPLSPLRTSTTYGCVEKNPLAIRKARPRLSFSFFQSIAFISGPFFCEIQSRRSPAAT